MPRTLALDKQYFAVLREEDNFYVDKTSFISGWWKCKDTVTLITRPRRFGKTLMMSTVECFFSTKYAGCSDLFEGLEVWNNPEMRAQQGTWPVIFLSLANLKPGSFAEMLKTLNESITEVYNFWEKVLQPEMNAKELARYASVDEQMDVATAKGSIRFLCSLLERHFGKKVIILLDEYDTPMQEAWLKDFWDETVGFFRGFFNATFKTNPSLERGLLTGITRISKESLFSDFNNLRIASTTTPMYETAFGFTEDEVFAAMDEYGRSDRAGVKRMYDGFTFGNVPDIYNPWSIISYLSTGRLDAHWVNTSGNGLVSKLMREGSPKLKKDCEALISGGTIETVIDEQIVFDALGGSEEAVWSLLMSAGYLKMLSSRSMVLEADEEGESPLVCTLALTNGEVRKMMKMQISQWFRGESSYREFQKALLEGNLRYMNQFMNDVARNCFSSFDAGVKPSEAAPERFYHGFVLGLIVDMRDRYIVTSNRESGFGRYDVMLEPRNPAQDPAFIFEFKVFDSYDEKTLEDTVAAAHAQIEEKAYAAQLIERGIPADRIRKYGFAFEGKKVLIG